MSKTKFVVEFESESIIQLQEIQEKIDDIMRSFYGVDVKKHKLSKSAPRVVCDNCNHFPMTPIEYKCPKCKGYQ